MHCVCLHELIVVENTTFKRVLFLFFSVLCNLKISIELYYLVVVDPPDIPFLSLCERLYIVDASTNSFNICVSLVRCIINSFQFFPSILFFYFNALHIALCSISGYISIVVYAVCCIE